MAIIIGVGVALRVESESLERGQTLVMNFAGVRPR
jgi:hypothetical protein